MILITLLLLAFRFCSATASVILTCTTGLNCSARPGPQAARSVLRSGVMILAAELFSSLRPIAEDVELLLYSVQLLENLYSPRTV